jgi:hypothetical protein
MLTLRLGLRPSGLYIPTVIFVLIKRPHSAQSKDGENDQRTHSNNLNPIMLEHIN